MVYSTETYTNNGIDYNASNTYEKTKYPLVNRTAEDVPIDILIMFGPTNPYFDLIHYTALVCLAVSILISLYTVIYLLTSEKGNVFNWKIGKWSFLYQLNSEPCDKLVVPIEFHLYGRFIKNILEWEGNILNNFQR